MLLFTSVPLLAMSAFAVGASPYTTGDPGVLAAGTVQAAAWIQGAAGGDAGTTGALGIELSYGLGHEAQIGASVPLGFSAPNRGAVEVDGSTLESGVKYAFLTQTEEGWWPTIAFCPSVQFAFRRPPQEMGDTASHFFFPLWGEYAWPEWSVFGGGGYRTNPGRLARDSIFAGMGVTHVFAPHLRLGLEAFDETGDERGTSGTARFNAGATYDLSDALALQLSLGSSLAANAKASGIDYFVGIEWTTGTARTRSEGS